MMELGFKELIGLVLITILFSSVSYYFGFIDGEESGYDWGYDICKAEGLREDLIYYNDGDAEYWFNNGTGRKYKPNDAISEQSE